MSDVALFASHNTRGRHPMPFGFIIKMAHAAYRLSIPRGETKKRSHIRLLTAADPIRKPLQPILTFPLSCVCFDHRRQAHNQRQAWMFPATAYCTAKLNH